MDDSRHPPHQRYTGSPCTRNGNVQHSDAEIQDALAKVDLTITNVIEMINDSGITGDDIMEVYEYIKNAEDSSASETVMLSEDVEVPVYLLRYYEQTLADWLMLGGIDVQYDQWGW